MPCQRKDTPLLHVSNGLNFLSLAFSLSLSHLFLAHVKLVSFLLDCHHSGHQMETKLCVEGEGGQEGEQGNP